MTKAIDKVKEQEFDSLSAIHWADDGQIEEWVHKYLQAGNESDREFSKGLKREARWWNGPFKIEITKLSPAVGPEPGLEYTVDAEQWLRRISLMAELFNSPKDLPPLVIEYRSGELSVRDGNTRLGAMKHLGWQKCWVVIWYNSEGDYTEHSKKLLTQT